MANYNQKTFSDLNTIENKENRRWYVLQVYSGKEKKIKFDIEERIKIKRLNSFFGKILVPTEKIIEIKGGHKKKN